jgi:hypothetical protein
MQGRILDSTGWSDFRSCGCGRHRLGCQTSLLWQITRSRPLNARLKLSSSRSYE